MTREEREIAAQAREEVIEECARIADKLVNASTPGMPLFGAGMCNAADQIAMAIRALKSAQGSSSTSQTTPASSEPQTAASEAINGGRDGPKWDDPDDFGLY